MSIFQDLAQDPETGEVLSEEKTLSVIDLIFSGGTGSVVIISVLFLMLGVALYIYFERILAIKAASKIDKNFMNQIRDYVTGGKLDAAKMLCAQTDSPVARLTEKGVSRIGKPLDDINTAIEDAMYHIQRNGNAKIILLDLSMQLTRYLHQKEEK